MKSINIQINKVNNAMQIDQRGIFKRITKLFEEHGELYEAYTLNKRDNIIEEAVDNFIVLTSLLHEVDNTLLEKSEQFAMMGLDQALKDRTLTWKTNNVSLLMNYTIVVGKMVDIIQKHEQIISSRYKGGVSKEETVDSILHSIRVLFYFIATITMNTDHINILIDKKINKWIEKVS